MRVVSSVVFSVLVILSFGCSAEDAPTTAPTITAPSGSGNSTTPEFTWTTVEGSTFTDFWLDNLSTGTSQLIREQALPGTSFTPATALPNDSSFRCWARAGNGAGYGPWSAAKDFGTGNGAAAAPSSAPTLNSPTGGGNSTTPQFFWSSVAGATKYDLQVDDLSSGTTQVIHEQNISGTSFIPTTALAEHSYRFWIRAGNAYGFGPWSAAGNFAVGDAPTAAPTAAPSVTAPNDNNVSVVPTFTWTNVADAEFFDLWVDNLTQSQSQVIRQQHVIGTSYTPTAEICGHCSHRVWVRAGNGYGWGPWSAAHDFATGGAPTAAPTGTPSITAPTGTGNSTTPQLAWTEVVDATFYDVWIDALSTGQTQIVRQNAVGLTFTTPAIANNEVFRAWVRAGNSYGHGPWSAARDFGTGNAPAAAPTAAPTITAPSNAGNPTAPEFVWTSVTDATFYDLWLDNVSTGESQVIRQNVTGLAFTPGAALPNDNSYVVWLRAGNPYGHGPWSARKDFAIGNAPFTAPTGMPTITAPVGIEVAITAAIEWTAVANATRYDLWIDDTTSGQAQVIRAVVTGTSFTPQTPLVATHAYRVWVQAQNFYGNGPWSAEHTFTTVENNPETPPDVPTMLTPTGTNIGRFPNFSWTAAARAEYYEIELTNLTTTEVTSWVVFGTSDDSNYVRGGQDSSVRVRAWNSYGESAYSTAITFSTAPYNGPELRDGPFAFPAGNNDAVQLFVIGDDADPNSLTYTWVATGPGTVDIPFNGTTFSNFTTAQLHQPGTYDFQVTITNTNNQSITANVSFTQDVFPHLEISPDGPVDHGDTLQLIATLQDQFGNSIETEDEIIWAVSDFGTIDQFGLFTADAPGGGTAFVTAQVGAAFAEKQIEVRPAIEVRIVSPADGLRLPAPATFNFTVEATNSIGPIDKVQLLIYNTIGHAFVLRETTTAPYTFTWEDVPVGKYKLKARAFGSGISIDSGPISVISRYTVAYLGGLHLFDDGNRYATPSALNDNGVVTGYSFTLMPWPGLPTGGQPGDQPVTYFHSVERAFRWQNGVMEDLGAGQVRAGRLDAERNHDTGTAATRFTSTGVDINNDNVVAGWANVWWDFCDRACIFDGGVTELTPVAPLPVWLGNIAPEDLYPLPEQTFAHLINDNGVAVGPRHEHVSHQAGAWAYEHTSTRVWSSGGTVDLPAFVPLSINNHDQILGADGGGDFIYEDGVKSYITLPDGTITSGVNKINNNREFAAVTPEYDINGNLITFFTTVYQQDDAVWRPVRTHTNTASGKLFNDLGHLIGHAKVFNVNTNNAVLMRGDEVHLIHELLPDDFPVNGFFDINGIQDFNNRDEILCLGDGSTNSFLLTTQAFITDHTGPLISAESVIVGAEGPDGAHVELNVFTWDECGVHEVTHSHESGSLFPIGVTIVSVTAKDGFGNETTTEFKVIVVATDIRIAGLNDEIEDVAPGKIVRANDNYDESNEDGGADNTDSDLMNIGGFVTADSDLIVLTFNISPFDDELFEHGTFRLTQEGEGKVRVFASSVAASPLLLDVNAPFVVLDPAHLTVNGAFTFLAEGVEPGSVNLRLEYMVDGETLVSDVAQAQVVSLKWTDGEDNETAVAAPSELPEEAEVVGRSTELAPTSWFKINARGIPDGTIVEITIRRNGGTIADNPFFIASNNTVVSPFGGEAQFVCVESDEPLILPLLIPNFPTFVFLGIQNLDKVRASVYDGVKFSELLIAHPHKRGDFSITTDGADVTGPNQIWSKTRYFYPQDATQGFSRTFFRKRQLGHTFFVDDIDRYIPGVDQQGIMQATSTLTTNGVVSVTAKLLICGYFEGDASRGPTHLNINNRHTTSWTPAVNEAGLWVFDIPIDSLKYPGAKGTTGRPTGTLNQIDISVATAHRSTIYWIEISFDAMSPYILVHGKGANSWFWNGYPPLAGTTTFDPANGQAFPGIVGYFGDARIPYDDSINLGVDPNEGENSQGSIVEQGEEIGSLLPAIARRLGTRHVNLLCHSKGGLDSRHWLASVKSAREIANNTPVNDRLVIGQFITLDTPHRGSVVADYTFAGFTLQGIQHNEAKTAANAIHADIGLIMDASWWTQHYLGVISGRPDTEALRDLMTSQMITFNNVNMPLLNAYINPDGTIVDFRASQGDPDSNADQELTNQNPDELEASRRFAGYITGSNANSGYQALARVASVTLKATSPYITQAPTASFEKNDTLVAYTSALPLLVPSNVFLLHYVYDGPNVGGSLYGGPRDHATIANANTGRNLLTLNHIASLK